jgi:cytochrome c-type biogenesis protein CcmE
MLSRLRSMKYRNIIIFIVGLGLLVAAVFSLSDNILSPYVPFAEAKSRPGSYVQVIGSLDRSAPVMHGEGEFTFMMKDKDGSSIKALYRGIKPQNFEHADQVVLLGRYDAGHALFVADKLLVKCPSKYRRTP